MKRALLALALFAVVAAAIAAAHAQPILIYNPSESVPSGFYRRVGVAPRLGAFVTVRAVDVAPAYAALRDYADPTDRFLKRVAAARGQTVCAEGSAVSINGEPIAARASHDSEGQALPTWRGCRTLGADEVFLLGDSDDSFDGRYWGPTRFSDIDGVWTPLRFTASHTLT